VSLEFLAAKAHHTHHTQIDIPQNALSLLSARISIWFTNKLCIRKEARRLRCLPRWGDLAKKNFLSLSLHRLWMKQPGTSSCLTVLLGERSGFDQTKGIRCRRWTNRTTVQAITTWFSHNSFLLASCSNRPYIGLVRWPTRQVYVLSFLHGFLERGCSTRWVFRKGQSFFLSFFSKRATQVYKKLSDGRATIISDLKVRATKWVALGISLLRPHKANLWTWRAITCRSLSIAPQVERVVVSARPKWWRTCVRQQRWTVSFLFSPCIAESCFFLAIFDQMKSRWSVIKLYCDAFWCLKHWRCTKIFFTKKKLLSFFSSPFTSSRISWSNFASPSTIGPLK